MQYTFLQQVRKEHGDTLQDLAKLLKLSAPSGYARKEKGKVPFRLQEAFLIADRYGMTVEELFGEAKNFTQ